MDYCECGEQAKSRCRRCGEFLCRLHQTRYPDEPLFALYVDHKQVPLSLSRPSGPALQLEAGEETRLCSACRNAAIDETMPKFVSLLTEIEGGSPEGVALRLLDARCWWVPSPGGNGISAPAIVTQVAGKRPSWLHDDSLLSMTTLYATLARARSIRPPALRMIHENSHRTTGWLSGNAKDRRRTTDLGSVNAWFFHYKDDGSFCGVLVGPHGAARMVDSGWSQTMGTSPITHKLWGNGEYDVNIAAARKYVAELQQAMSANPPAFTREPMAPGYDPRVLIPDIRKLMR